MENSKASAPTPIEIRVDKISQLFDTLDPFPFHERDLDKDAEEYIIGWARELSRAHPIAILIHVPPDELKKQDPRALAHALSRYFDYRRIMTERELKELFRVGRISLLIGLSVLAACLTATQLIAKWDTQTPIGEFVRESLIILGWVANWKPIEIFLYEWWPLARRRNLYRRLANASVELKAQEIRLNGDDRNIAALIPSH